ncbi:MAG: bifunctional folylpolyglutamate synthase/dihydrofolate synthase [Chloroflexota bacterium]
MDYIDTLLYINTLTDGEREHQWDAARRELGPARMARLCELLDRPQDTFLSVHVAGTKGKGSTAAMIQNSLVAAGVRAGLYTSPHLHTMLERIKLNRRLIDEEDMAAAAELAVPAVERLHAESPELGRVTAFELITAMAFLFYARKDVRVAVLETGMGGRLDATRVAAGPVAVITAVSRDHMAALGETLAAIAREKAGLVKAGATLVSPAQAPAVEATLEEVCAALPARLLLGGRDWRWQEEHDSAGRPLFSVASNLGHYRGLGPALLGAHQRSNAAGAVVALQSLRELGVGVSDEAIGTGLATVRWPGRLEVVGREPTVVLDGMHNADSARRLREALGDVFRYERLTLVLGISADKEIGAIVPELAPLAHRLIVTRSSHYRAAPLEALVAACREVGLNPETAETPVDALALARAGAGPRDLICVTGSLYLVAEAREACGLESVG